MVTLICFHLLLQLGQDLVSPLHSAALAGALLAEAAVPRLWDGKEAIIDAIGAVAKWCPRKSQPVPCLG
jgi:hypothetical protein